MRVLVTGGSGFIGSHVVDKLRARGHQPVIYALRPSPWHKDPDHPVDTVLGSITDREALERALHSCDAVAHLAAVADVNDVHASPEAAERVNARGTVTVLEAARAREAAVIPAFVNKALAGDPLTLAGDGMQSRKFVYVEDLADGVARGLDEVAVNRVYNLASDETVTIKQIAETIKDLMGDVEIVYTPARPGDFGGKIVSSDRAERELGWTAATPFSEGVRKYIGWRQEQAELAKGQGGGGRVAAGGGAAPGQRAAAPA